MAALLVASLLAQPAAAARALHVAPAGSDTASGTAAQPLRTVQRAVDRARAGDTILVHSGTYSGAVTISRSGTAAAPITLRPAGDGPVRLVTDYRPLPCDRSGPTSRRTIVVTGGADHWTISGLQIVGGVFVKGENATAALHYLNSFVDREDWRGRRAVPGRGENDPVAARRALAYLSQKIGKPIDPSDGIRLLGNTISQRGVQIITSRYGVIAGNRITDIQCGTGPAVWVNVYSDGWQIRDNYIARVAESTHKHYMQEGVRLGSASSYNVVERNTAEHLPGDGRAFATDVDASFNVFAHNTANDVAMGYNDQMSGWGNRWEYNTATNFRVWGLNFRGLDASLRAPSLHSSTYRTVVRCNVARGGPTDPVDGGGLRIGAAKQSTFANNYVDSVILGSYEERQFFVREYWAREGNTWDGRSTPPPLHPRLPPPGACG